MSKLVVSLACIVTRVRFFIMSTCSQCKFFEKGGWGSDGVCRRYPPVVVVGRWKSQTGIIKNEVMEVDRVRSEFPATSGAGFCGEFSA